MFNKSLISKNKRDIIIFDYAHNINSRHRKRKWRIVLKVTKWLIVGCMFAMSILYVSKLQAAGFNQFTSLEDVASGQLLLESSERIKTAQAEQRLFKPAVLINSSAEFDINGIVATVTVTQSFLNTSDTVANGLYTFPLPENSAVNYLNIQMGNKTIEGKILEKQQAKAIFIKAKAQGRKASLVEQHRPNLFTNSIANIAPKEQVTVTIKYVQQVDYDKGEFSLRFPMTITPRYIPNSSVPNSSAPSSLSQIKPMHSTEENVNNIERQKSKNTNPQYVHHSTSDHLLVGALSHLASLQSHNIQLNVNLNAGLPLDSITSESHKITTTKSNAELPTYQVSVGNVQVPMDRDFVISWRPEASSIPKLSVVHQMLDGESYALAMLIPPTFKSSDIEKQNNLTMTNKNKFARDVTFIIDTSGSMQGDSIKQAKQSLRFALNTLNSQDSFNIISFESTPSILFNTTVMASPQNIKSALSFINNLTADGGTEMYKPLASALTMPQSAQQNSRAIKQILFITDGAVGNEKELFSLIKNTIALPRLFTVGIGRAPNGYFMRKAAQFGQGSYTYIGNTNEVEEKMSNLLRKISQPILKNIKVQFTPLHTGSLEQFPNKIPDLYADEPLIIAFKTAIMPKGLQLYGELNNQPWQDQVSLSVANNSEGSSITSIWARAKIEDLLDGLITGKTLDQVKPQVLETSIKHQVMSPYTSFIAVEKERKQPDLLANAHSKDSLKVSRRQALTKMRAAPFPTTAVGWSQSLLIGILLLLISCALFFSGRTTRFNT